MPDIDLMGYMPDPDEQVQVVPIVRDNNFQFQAVDTESDQTFIVSFMMALKMTGQISYLTGRIRQSMIESAVAQMSSASWEVIKHAAGDPTDEHMQRETFRRNLAPRRRAKTCLVRGSAAGRERSSRPLL